MHNKLLEMVAAPRRCIIIMPFFPIFCNLQAICPMEVGANAPSHRVIDKPPASKKKKEKKKKERVRERERGSSITGEWCHY
jgi:hypothetical protein